MLIGLVSDTHGHFDEALPRLFAGCDLIVHGGDVVGQEILHFLSVIAPVKAVRGNNDRGPQAEGLPEELVLHLGGLKTLVLHELGKPLKPVPAARAALSREDPRVVVYGHSHRPDAAVVGGRLYVNPGSAGRKRFSLPRTAALMDIAGRRARLVFHDLSLPGAPVRGEALVVDL